jgi:hypothetical protein
MATKALYIPNTRLTLSTTGVTGANCAAGLGNAFTYVVPDGVVMAIPKYLRPKMKLLDGVSTEMPRDTKWGLGLITTVDSLRVVPIGPQMFPYTDWLDLGLNEQGKTPDYERMTTVDITKASPVIVFNQDETLVFQVYSAAGTLDISECTIELPVFWGRTTDISTELGLRLLEIGH